MEWIPEFGLKRELDWLNNMHDWLISKKNRYWGLALPIWECSACGFFEVIGSQEELKQKAIQGWEKFAGHTQTSTITGEYQHYGGDDVKEMQLNYAGKTAVEKEKSYELKKIPIKCPHCDKSNLWDAEICGFCLFEKALIRQDCLYMVRSLNLSG